MIRVGVIGYGYWGPNLVRNIAETKGLEIAAVSDLSAARLRLVESRFPGVKTSVDYREVVDSPDIDAIAISTPVSTHLELAMAALKAGKHVLVEKPLTTTSEESLRLIEEADRRNLTLMVDHTFVYTGAVRKIHQLVSTGELGDLYYYDSVRINLGLFQYDVDVIHDLAVHDFAIMDYLLPWKPVAVSATGISHVPSGKENIAYITTFFGNSMIAHVHVNWLSPVKVRQTLIGGSRRMILYDDLEPSEKIKIYDKGIDVSQNQNREAAYQMLVSYRAGDMWAPKLDLREALATEMAHFADCINGGAKPMTDGNSGYRVVRIIEAAEESMKMSGASVEIDTRRTNS